MTMTRRSPGTRGLILLAAFLILFSLRSFSQQRDDASVIRGIDASVTAREDHLIGYTATEHYVVYRNGDQQHPAAEMYVKTTYHSDTGKTYQILSETGSVLLRKQLLERMLDSEKTVTQPAIRRTALINSTNYDMAVKGTATQDGRPGLVMEIAPRRISPYLFRGQIWVDAQDYSIVRLEGITSKSPTVFASPTQVSRQYRMVNGFPMATHATASTAIFLVGQTTIAIDYTNYVLQVAANSTSHPAPAETKPAN